MKSDHELLLEAADLLGATGYIPSIAHSIRKDSEWVERRRKWCIEFLDRKKRLDFVCTKCGGTGLSR